jgi:hypothetical protein
MPCIFSGSEILRVPGFMSSSTKNPLAFLLGRMRRKVWILPSACFLAADDMLAHLFAVRFLHFDDLSMTHESGDEMSENFNGKKSAAVFPHDFGSCSRGEQVEFLRNLDRGDSNEADCLKDPHPTAPSDAYI